MLIVDDEDEIREILRECAQTVVPNTLIVEASNGIEAISKAERQYFDCIVSDIAMPRATGIELIHAISRLRPESRPKSILVLSGHFSAEKAAELPLPIEYLPKPCNIEQIRDFFEKVFLNDETPETESPDSPQSQASPAIPSTPSASATGNTAQKNKILQTVSIYLNSMMQTLQEEAELQIHKEAITAQKGARSKWDVAIVTAVEPTCYFEYVSFSCSLPFFSFLCDQLKNKLADQIGNITPTECAQQFFKNVHSKTTQALTPEGIQLKFGTSILWLGKELQMNPLSSKNSIVVKFGSDLGNVEIEFLGLK